MARRSSSIFHSQSEVFGRATSLLNATAIFMQLIKTTFNQAIRITPITRTLRPEPDGQA
jgi:hypothetical protein